MVQNDEASGASCLSVFQRKAGVFVAHCVACLQTSSMNSTSRLAASAAPGPDSLVYHCFISLYYLNAAGPCNWYLVQCWRHVLSCVVGCAVAWL